jgi:cytochrome c biogenesis factor
LDNSGYLLAREMTTRLGQPIIYLILFLSIVLAMAALVPAWRKYMHHCSLAVFLSFASGWLLLANFHYRIATDIQLFDPSGAMTPGRFYIPVWIEDEKFFFWTLALAALVLLSRYKDMIWRVSLNLTLAIFGVLTFFTSNPFAEPLKDFHAAYSNYAAVFAASNVDPTVKAQAYYPLYGQMVGFYNSEYMWIHPPLLFISYAAFTMAFVGGILMLLRRDNTYDDLGYAYAKAGFIVLTMGMLLGYPWALEAWKGQPWWYDPKINITLMMWVLYSAYLHTRLYMHRRGMWTTTAVLNYLAYFGVIFTYVSTYLIPGIHSVA